MVKCSLKAPKQRTKQADDVKTFDIKHAQVKTESVKMVVKLDMTKKP